MTNIILATITAYCSCVKCCPKQQGITANGQRPVQGITIAASRNIPFGSKVIVPSTWLHAGGNMDRRAWYQTYTVQDRLAKKYDSRFDIYFTKHSDAKKFGIKTNQVTIITK